MVKSWETQPCNIHICLITRCVIKGLHCNPRYVRFPVYCFIISTTAYVVGTHLKHFTEILPMKIQEKYHHLLFVDLLCEGMLKINITEKTAVKPV